MLYRTGSQIREDFLRFFETKAHRRVHSSSLVPHNDPTLLFTNAGMNQFKDVFLGAERRDYTRATTSQKCVRAGGKHNDLENVGFTRRHHTFFEMLGNFSFGDYFKPEAIAFAWELLTSKEWFAIDPTRLYVTIFEGDSQVPRDTEAYDLWLAAGVPPDRIHALSAKDNFWAMGDTGPCGPCSEIYFDLGPEASETGRDLPFGQDDQRYMEIWNLVFMQFDRSSDGILTPLPKPSIDTGMGLERIACVLQSVLSNYQTDLFVPLIQRAAELTGYANPSSSRTPLLSSRSAAEGSASEPATNPGAPGLDSETWVLQGGTHFSAAAAALSDEKSAASLRIIADHARAATFLISDGVRPMNEGRGYVLRKILRRAIRHGRLLGQEKPFLFEMVRAVRDEMSVAYPELIEHSERVSATVLAEEEQFARILGPASTNFEELLNMHEERSLRQVAYEKDHPDHPFEWSSWVLPGHYAFMVYETTGLPLEFMIEAARDRGFHFDLAGFERALEEERARARASWRGGSQKSTAPIYRDLPKTEFEGYSALRLEGARILALIQNGVGVPALEPGQQAEAILDATSFYADSGGQVGDTGQFLSGQTILAEVHGATKPIQGVFAHRITTRERLAVGDLVTTAVDPETRAATMRNHTGTHLLHAALRHVLGTHVKQAGSLVNPTRLRFDFSHFTSIAEPELREIESIVNRQVLANTPVQTFVDVPIDTAINDYGAMALFGEKYGDRVRVVKIGDFSTELCGGTHIAATGEIGLLKLVGESSVASGVRRLEALSGTGALDQFRRDADVARIVPGGPSALRDKLTADDEEIKRLRKELDQLRLKAASASVANAAASAVEVQGIKVLTQRVDGVEKAQLRELVDNLRHQLGSGIVILGAATEGKVTLIVGVTKDLTTRIQAGKLVAALAPMVGGKGGGRPDLAEAGGTNVEALNATLTQAPALITQLLA